MTTAQKPLTAPFTEIDKEDLALVGGKGANLGEMTKAGFPVPPGFAITVEAFDRFIDENSLGDQINNILKKIDVHNSDQSNFHGNKDGNSQSIQKAFRKI